MQRLVDGENDASAAWKGSLNNRFVEGFSILFPRQVCACKLPNSVAPTVAPRTVAPQIVGP